MSAPLNYRYLPLTVYLSFALFTIACLFFGPVTYQGINYFLLMGFLGAFLVLFAAGYLWAVRGKFSISSEERIRASMDAFAKVRGTFRWLLLWSCASSVLKWITLFSSHASIGFDSIGDAYSEGYRDYVRGDASIGPSYILNIFDQTIVILAVIIGLAYYRSLPRKSRVGLQFVLASFVLANMLGSGKQVYIGYIAIYASVSALRYAAIYRKKITAKTVFIGLTATAVVLLAMVEVLRQRYEYAGVSLANVRLRSHPLMIWDVDSPLVKLVGQNYGLAIGYLTTYFTNGLYGLYLSLTLPFEWSYFLGSSYSLGRIVEIVTGNNGAIFERTYPFRVGDAYGWGMTKWHSAFSWIASDVGFVGILMLTPFFAAAYARIWKEAVNSVNPYAAPLFMYLSLGLAFSFANNQMVHALSGVLVLSFLVWKWGRFARKAKRASRLNRQPKWHGAGGSY
jgi:hypothetical protein